MGSTESSEADWPLGTMRFHVLFYIKQRFNAVLQKLTSDTSDLNSIRLSIEYSGGMIAIRFYMVFLSNSRRLPEEYSNYGTTSIFDVFLIRILLSFKLPKLYV